MSISSAQSDAFNAASGATAQASTNLIVGSVMTVAMLWAAWALYSIWRGWATKNIDRSIASSSAIRVLLLLMVLSFIVLS
ncbi:MULTISPECIES: TIGR03758 family integrating conjugative element protein [unclassified Pseudomonas]|uniref:TIGR03758 family integrating conjugative element protein n=1 Tax=unclassified Pseudomonas TaxID=196821 RepID=UPI000CD261C4|nr:MULTISPECIES: TIGR03758 family integrating conjugative element protein [unclassified Pseudomonas]POA51848.1 TIGR03758 family integrating conjugative element protein [Pseudomonas sp. FW507-12TSA]UMZ09802.1 TIGR03758 family integrating conjugative element protein [Pseudomonas sp. MPFS]